jgi:hypothetical protein
MILKNLEFRFGTDYNQIEGGDRNGLRKEPQGRVRRQEEDREEEDGEEEIAASGRAAGHSGPPRCHFFPSSTFT